VRSRARLRRLRAFPPDLPGAALELLLRGQLLPQPALRRAAGGAGLGGGRPERAPVPRYASRLPPEAREAVTVREERGYEPDLVPESSPFSLRFVPSPPELEWRYGLALPFVRYRLFRILARGRTCGYVVLEDAPAQVIVSHCDGSDPRLLAWGVLQALLEACREDTRPRSVLLASSHPEMRRHYEAFGFHLLPERPLALGPARPGFELPSDPRGWLVNYDWGDNGLRPPFRGQEAPVDAEQAGEE
jgi:hypothetical protein